MRDCTIGLFEGTSIERVVLVNASPARMPGLRDSEDCPTWVDRVYPSDLIIQQYNWCGAYKGGWLNCWLGQNGVVRTTPGTDGELGYNYIAKDDDIWMYTGVTSATGDNSIVGFVLVNQRTSESHFYSVAGATEDSATGVCGRPGAKPPLPGNFPDSHQCEQHAYVLHGSERRCRSGEEVCDG